MNKIKITALQSSLVWQNHEANLDCFSKKIRNASPDSDLIILPEMFLTGFVVNPTHHSVTMDGDELKRLVELSSKVDAVICGSLIIRESKNYYNRLLWISPDGEVQYYDKRHLFTFGGEDKNFVAGEKKPVFTLNGIKIKPLICYDLRFPVWSKNSYDKDAGYGYDMLIYTANWPEPRKEVWRALLKARAIENQCFVVGVNRVGTDGEGLTYTGDSMVISARGEVVAAAVPSQEETIEYTIDKNHLEEFRAKFPVGPDWDSFSVKNSQ